MLSKVDLTAPTGYCYVAYAYWMMVIISERNRPCLDRLDALMTQAVAVANAIRDNAQDEQQPIPSDLVLSFSRDYDKIITALSDASWVLVLMVKS